MVHGAGVESKEATSLWFADMRFRPVFIGDSACFRIFEKRPDPHLNAPRRRFDVTNCPEEWIPRGYRSGRCCRSSTLAGAEVGFLGFEENFKQPLMTIQEVAGARMDLSRFENPAVVQKHPEPKHQRVTTRIGGGEIGFGRGSGVGFRPSSGWRRPSSIDPVSGSLLSLLKPPNPMTLFRTKKYE